MKKSGVSTTVKDAKRRTFKGVVKGEGRVAHGGQSVVCTELVFALRQPKKGIQGVENRREKRYEAALVERGNSKGERKEKRT